MLPTHSKAQQSPKDVVRSRWAVRVACAVAGVVFVFWWMLPTLPYDHPFLAPPPPPGHGDPERFELFPPEHHPPPPPPPKGGEPKAGSEPSGSSASDIWATRADAVKKSFLYAYNNYEKDAMPLDEMLPLSGWGKDVFNGWGVTVVDSLSTMWLMGLKPEYERALEHVSTLNFRNHTTTIPFFETAIRYLGGLLSAYALTKEPVFLARADELGSVMLPVFRTNSGLPLYSVTPNSGVGSFGWAYGSTLLAEMASCQMEYKYLAHLTGRKDYFTTVERVMDIMKEKQSRLGLWPTYFNTDTAHPTNAEFSVGGNADSAYEYLLKQYLLTSKSEPKMLKMYLTAIEGVLDNMLYLSPTRNLLYVTDIYIDRPSNKLEHLSCFFPGLLALGAQTLDLPPETAQLHKWAAEGLATTCWLMYADQPSGIGGEAVTFRRWKATPQATPTQTDAGLAGAGAGLGGGAVPGVEKANGPVRGTNDNETGRWMIAVKEWKKAGRVGGVPPGVRGGKPIQGDEASRDYSFLDARYLLRPETIESIFLLWRTTGDPVWRERGWEIFQSIEKHARTPHGYASLSNINSAEPLKLNEQPSYFFAETLKYLFLLFSDESVLPLDKYVLNTEAHPLPIFEWSAWERRRFNISSSG